MQPLINIEKFNQCPLAIQVGALKLWGTHLASYSESGNFRRLYYLQNFFAEIVIDEYGQQITRVWAFSNPDLLNPYLTKLKRRSANA